MIDISTEEKPKKPAPKRWDEDEEARLTKAFQLGASVEDMAEKHERTTGAIESRLQLLDLISYDVYNKAVNLSGIPGSDETPENTGKKWTNEDKTRLLNMHNTSPGVKNLIKLAEELGRSPRSLVMQLVVLEAIKTELNHNPKPQPKPKKPKKVKKIVEVTKPTRTMKVTITPEFQAGLRTIESGDNLLILGSAGTGKSTFLKWIRKKIADTKNYVVLAPTGMAALQVGGQTIHSFFGFKPQLMDGPSAWRKPRNTKVYEKLDLVIIDEISMVRADIFESIDKFLRRYGPKKGEPFGGVQLLVMGDLFQLSPIVRREEQEYFKDMFGTPFFFGSEAWKNGDFHFLEFSHIFRQSDEPFINLLNRVRHGERNKDLLDSLNQRLTGKPAEDSVILAARNRTVDTINECELAKLTTEKYTYTAKKTGRVDEGSFTSPVELTLRVGARVMFTRNDVNARWVNGTLAEVIVCRDDNVTVKTDDGEIYKVESVKWELTKYEFDDKTDKSVAIVAGTFSQLPLTLAWALTIHKAQGQTLENCTIDLSDGGIFAEGQLYVALSRARSLESIHLTAPISPSDIRTSLDVKGFYKSACMV
jgi:ATP-dependent DNA helicase PIF1